MDKVRGSNSKLVTHGPEAQKKTCHTLLYLILFGFFLPIGAYLIGLRIHKLPILFVFHLGLPLTTSFFYISGLTLNCQYFSFFSSGLTSNCQFFLFLHLGLHSTASTFYFSSGLNSNQFFSFFIWTYL